MPSDHHAMTREHNYYNYLLASKKHGTLYVGVTNDLLRRVSEHRLGQASAFTRKYGIDRLVWYEAPTDINQAIQREKRLKKWNRQWKVNLIEAINPNWRDLLTEISG